MQNQMSQLVSYRVSMSVSGATAKVANQRRLITTWPAGNAEVADQLVLIIVCAR
jgi:hypothetical protein